MKTQKRHIRFVAFSFVLLLCFSLLSLPLAAEEKGANATLLSKCDAIESALSVSFAKKADALDRLASEYLSPSAPTENENGIPQDNAAIAAALQAEAAALRTLSFHSYRLAIIEYAYEKHYIGTYRSIAEVSDAMTDFLVRTYFIDQLDADAATDRLILCYMAAIGDKYASYYNEAAYDDLSEDNNASYSGIGVTVTKLETGYVEIISVTEDSPADKAGLCLGDIIVAVEGTDFNELGYTTAINTIRGEEGMDVTITVERAGERFDVTMTRAKLIEYTVTYKMLQGGDGKIGYIRISQFDNGTFGQFVEAVRVLGEAGAEKYVFDVRNNPGGMLDSVLAVLDYILPDDTGKPLVRIQYKDQQVTYDSVYAYVKGDSEREERYKAAFNHQINAPFAVLCNAYTASAGELFTSCLKDFGVAEIFGTTTFGKGTGQSGYLLSDIYAYADTNERPGGSSKYFVKRALANVSTFYYAPPLSDNYEGVGVTPHHVVELSEEAAAISFYKLTEETDNQLAAVMAYLATKEGVPYDPSADTLPNEKNHILIKILLWILVGMLTAITLLLFAFLIVFLVMAKKKDTVARAKLEKMRHTHAEEDQSPPANE